MRILVTGVGGFVAPYVMWQLAKNTHQTDDLVIGTDVNPVRPKYTPPGEGYDHTYNWSFYACDLTDREQLVDLLRVARPDAICHLAAVGDVYLAAESPSTAMKAGPYLTAMLLEEAIKINPDVHFVYTSTWEVYGEPEYEPLDEEHPTRPDHPYSAAKLAGELVVHGFEQLHDLRASILRLGSAYGPGMRSRSVFSIFRDRAVEGKPLTVFGDPYRQWTHVGDIARGFQAVLNSTHAVGETYNLVSDEKVSIKALAEIVADRYGVEVKQGPARPGDVPPAMVTSRKIKRQLRWCPLVKFRDGLEAMLEAEE